MRHSELLTNEQYIPRVRELEAQGAGYWTIVVVHGGYEISFAFPSAQSDLFSKTSSSEHEA